MKVTAILVLVLSVPINPPLIPETLHFTGGPQTPYHQHFCSQPRALSVPLLSMVTLPGLSETSVNIPAVGDTGVLYPSWQVYLSAVPIQSMVANYIPPFILDQHYS